jgi:peptidoglycan/LPS O-acetylase OafA/YrhL
VTKLPEIERLRACAILMVLVVHWRPLYVFMPTIARKPWSGVDLFFVISGYVVSLSLLRLLPAFDVEQPFLDAFASSRGALRTFYVRRFFRIIPPAVVAVLIHGVCTQYFPDQFGSTALWKKEAVTIFGGMYNYSFVYNVDFRMGVYWSLAVEEHFYLLLPMIFVLFRTTNRRLLACVIVGAISIACRTLPVPEGAGGYGWMKFTSHLRFDSLMAGVALALLASKPSTRMVPRSWMRFAIVPALLLLVTCLPAAAPDDVMLHAGFIAIWGLSGALVALAGMDLGYVLSFPVLGRILEYIGSRSYALYVMHVPATWIELGAATKWARFGTWCTPTDPDRPWRQLLVTAALALFMTEVTHRLVERPTMAMGRRLIERAKRPSAPSGAAIANAQEPA